MIGIRIIVFCSVLFVTAGCGTSEDTVSGPLNNDSKNNGIAANHPNTWLPAATVVLIDENFDDNDGGFSCEGDGLMGAWQPLPEGNWRFHSERGSGHPLTALVRRIFCNPIDVLMFSFEVALESGFGGPDNPALVIGFSDGDFTVGDEDVPLAANSLWVSFSGAASRFNIGARDRVSTQLSSVAPADLIQNGNIYGVQGMYDPSTGLYNCVLTSPPGGEVLFDETIDLSIGNGFQGFDALTHYGILWPNFGGATSSINGTWDDVLVAARGAWPLELALDIKPRSCPNPINPKSKGKLPVAILGTADFNVLNIDVSTVLLEGITPVHSAVEDVSSSGSNSDDCDCPEYGPDGYDDLILKFMAQDILAAIGPVVPGGELVVTITGTLLDGMPFKASDCVVVVGNKNTHPGISL